MAKAYALSLSPKRSGETFIDVNTPLAFIVGFTAGVWGIDPSLSMVTFVAAKIVHKTLESDPKSALFKKGGGESLSNELGDVLINAAGVQLGTLLRERLTAPEAPEVVESPLPTQGFELRGIFR